MTNDTEDTTNVRQLTLNLVPPEKESKDEELRGLLDESLAILIEEVSKDKTKCFLAIVLDKDDNLSAVLAGHIHPFTMVGALRSTEIEILKDSQ